MRHPARTSGSSYKWEFLGGPPLVAEVATAEATTSTSYAALATAGPSCTAPIAGDYDVEVTSRNYCAGTSSAGYHSLDIGVTGAVDGDAALAQAGAAGATSVVLQRTRRKTGVAAGAAIVSKYKSQGPSVQFDNRRLAIRPVRVG